MKRIVLLNIVLSFYIVKCILPARKGEELMEEVS